MRLIDIEVDPRPIAIVRIALGIAVVINAVEISVVLKRIASGMLTYPVFDWTPAPTDSAVAVYLALAVLAGVAMIAGYYAGAAAIVSTVLSAGVLLWDQQAYSNHRLLVTLLVAYLVFAQSDAKWALPGGSRPQRTLVRWWPQLLMMTQLSFCYFFAALSKLNPVFLDGSALASWVRWPLPEELFAIMAGATVVTELFLAVGLWWRPTRALAVAVGVGLHLSIVFGMKEQTVPLIAFTLACVPTYVLFLTRPSLRGIGVASSPDADTETPAAAREVESSDVGRD